MSEFFSPYDADRPLMLKCSCGRDHTLADHHAEVAADAAAVELRRRSLTSEFEVYSNEFIEATLVKAIFPHDDVRRNFLRAVGKGETVFCHSLNNTVLASPRFLIPLLENHQNADGSVTIPEPLRAYMGGKTKIG